MQSRGSALRSTVMIGMSSGLGFVVSLARTKIVALVFGPVGVGAVGMMQSVLAMAALAGGFGIDTVVTREVAKAWAVADRVRVGEMLAVARRGVVVWGAIAGAVAVGVFWVAGDRLGIYSGVAALLLGVAVQAVIVSSSARGLLSGLGRIEDVAVASVVAAVVGLVASGVLTWLPSTEATWAAIALVVPGAQWLVFWVFGRRLGTALAVSFVRAAGVTYQLARQGGQLAVAGIVPVAAQLLVRAIGREHLGAQGFGYFQASLAIAGATVSVLAASVGTAVVPRLAVVANNPEELSLEVNEQARTYLVLFAPLAIMVAVVPEWVVLVLYSSEFSAVAEQLKFQIAGEVLRLPVWVLNGMLVARARARLCLVTELGTLVATVGLMSVAVRTGSLAVVGGGLALGMLVQFGLISALAAAEGVRWQGATLVRILGVAGAIVVIGLIGVDVVVVRLAGLVMLAIAAWRAAVALLPLMRRSGR